MASEQQSPKENKDAKSVRGKQVPEERIVPMRLQKFLARAGVASRRGSENLMTAGRVTVNGQVKTELGTKVDPLVDVVEVDGVEVRLSQGPVTLMLHKPVGVLTTMSDPYERPCVADLMPVNQYPGLFPIGRLDLDTTGLLLFSTDGELGHLLLRPRSHVMKYYLAMVDGVPTEDELQQLRDGVPLEDGMTLPAEVEMLRGAEEKAALSVMQATDLVPQGSSKRQEHLAKMRRDVQSVLRIGIHEGRKRQVRLMCSFVHHPVLALHRESFGPLSLDGLEAGQYRELSQAEVAALYEAVRAAEQRA